METRRHKNFMMIKNKLWEALYSKPLPEQERQVWDYIYRFTIGWGCEMKELSTYIIGKDLKIDDRCVRRVIRALKAKKRIIVKGKMKGIQKDFNLWTVGQISPIKEVGQIRPNNRTNMSVSVGQIRPLIKDTLKHKKKERENFTNLKEEDLEKNKEKALKIAEDLKKKFDDKYKSKSDW